MSDFNWYLWKRFPYDSDVRFLRVDDLPATGFASLYAVDETTATVLQKSADFRGFKGLVFSNTLSIDCDSSEAAEVVEGRLVADGYGYEKWSSGRRGAHFVLERVTNPSQNLPLRDKAWVKARFPEADSSIYSHLHLFRLPGGKHEKTGKPKELVLKVPGRPVEFEEDAAEPVALLDSNSGGPSRSIFEDVLVMSWSTPQTSGLRNKALATVAYRMAELGESEGFIFRWLQHVNSLFSEPKPEEELRKIVSYATNRSR